MGDLVSPNQYGDKGMRSPEAPANPGGQLVSPAKSTNEKEAAGHQEGMASKRIDPKGMKATMGR